MEEKVCDILGTIDVNVTTKDIEACHRLPYSRKENKDNPKRTIVKFINRKNCEAAMKNRKALKDTDKTSLNFPEDTRIFVNDSLCPYYRGLYGKCKSLYLSKRIFAFWSSNGVIKLKVEEKSNLKSITHDYDLHRLFPEIYPIQM